MKSKRLFAVITAVSLLLCGCQKIDNTDVPQETIPTEGSVIPVGEDILTTTAKSEPITLPDGLHGWYHTTPTDDGFFCVGDVADGNRIHLFHFHEDTLSFSETILVQPAPYDGYYYEDGMIAVGDDAIYCLAIMENHNNLPPYDENTDSDSYDWDLYYESWESAYYLCTYTMDGTLTSSVQLEGLEAYKNWQGYDQFCDLFAHDGKIYLLLEDSTVLLISMDGSFTETYKTEESNEYSSVSRILLDCDGKPVYYFRNAYVEADNTYNESVSLSDFKIQTGKPEEPFYTIEKVPVDTDMNITSGGYGEYRLFVNLGKTLCGIRDNGETEVVIDWNASDLPVMESIPLKDGTFLCQNLWDDENTVCHVSRKYASEIKEKQVIQLGILGESSIMNDFVLNFNSTHDNYRIQTISYQNSDGTDYDKETPNQDALDKLKLAVISDDAPDLLLLPGHHDTLLKLGSRGVFSDLYEIMADDADVNRDTLLPNVCKALEHPNGALYGLTQNFSVMSIAVKSQFCTQENWTIQNMIDLYEGADEVMYQWQTKDDTLQMLLTGTNFTDEMAGTCRFDSPEFIQMLEFCNRYPTELNKPVKNYDDPEAMAKLDKWYTDRYLRYQHDEDYLFFTGFSAINKASMASNWAYTKADLGGDFTLVGYPSDNGQGGKIAASTEMAILSTCKNKEAAWEALKAYLDVDLSASGYGGGYSIFETKFEEQMDDEMYIMESGERTDLEYYDDDSDVYPLTQEERDGLEAYIRGCETFMMLDENVKNIVLEEAGMYFSGDRSAEDTAKMIQSRAQIMLSEQS
ncbi:MAG: hypothetical protein K2I93_06400 [Oscillospiraceae bacterium]|nr:hypothetical protein [Oscillospiraceae bacterium]